MFNPIKFEFIFSHHYYRLQELAELAASKLGRSGQPEQRAGSGKRFGNNY